MVPNCTAADVDLELGEIIFGLDIVSFKAADPLLEDAIHAVKSAPRLYTPPT